MANSGAFQDQVQRLGKLIAQLDQLPEGPQKKACKEMVQVLLDLHGAGLERMMEIVFESGESGHAIIDKLGRDATVSSLLVLHSLHPDDLEARLQKAVEKIEPRLRKLGCSSELVQLSEAGVLIKITRPDHLCGSSANDVRAIVEESVYEFAPDVEGIEIIGLDKPSSGFVAVESLMPKSLVGATPASHILSRSMDHSVNSCEERIERA